jgi:hypothetical protein
MPLSTSMTLQDLSADAVKIWVPASFQLYTTLQFEDLHDKKPEVVNSGRVSSFGWLDILEEVSSFTVKNRDLKRKLTT